VRQIALRGCILTSMDIGAGNGTGKGSLVEAGKTDGH
jgi:hypothetical protein